MLNMGANQRRAPAAMACPTTNQRNLFAPSRACIMGAKASRLSISPEKAPPMHFPTWFALAALLVVPSFTLAVEHRVETVDEAAPADGLSSEIASKLEPSGVKVVRGTNRTVCTVWLCKEIETKADAVLGGGVQYPFQHGQLIGVIHYPRKGSDFRDQEIAAGTY